MKPYYGTGYQNRALLGSSPPEKESFGILDAWVAQLVGILDIRRHTDLATERHSWR